MKNLGKAQRTSSYDRLLNLTREFADAQAACDLLDDFLRRKSYERSFCVRLLALAKQKKGLPWDLRRLAILMLEHQTLKLAADNQDEFDWLFGELKLKQGPGLDAGIVKSVLREGFSTTETRLFIHEFRHKLDRLGRVHRPVRGLRTSGKALSEFLQLSRLDCKLSLARYLFTPDEVVAEILKQLQISDGVTDLNGLEPRHVMDQMKRTLNSLPDFEAAILKRLCITSDIYLVTDRTSSEINSQVEYPATTVVVVIKPPGSDIEFELKRAGRRGLNSLRVVYARNGYTVPPSHRLDGGSMQWLLRYETRNASKLAAIYRVAHQTAAPMSNYISRATVYSIPVGREKARTLTYFTHPHIFGRDYRRMRVALKESVAAFTSEGQANLPNLPGELGLTAQFIGHCAPAQAILSGTSSFRLDKLSAYLSSAGPEVYFKQIGKDNYFAATRKYSRTCCLKKFSAAMSRRLRTIETTSSISKQPFESRKIGRGLIRFTPRCSNRLANSGELCWP